MSQKETNKKDITRKDALKKMGSYAAFAALGTMIMLNPQKAQAVSAPDAPGFGGGNGVRRVRVDRNKK
ncbi:hypothetical protein N9758_00405 [Flavobacteriaceae bacterium]|nr:hypothetical protein [Flavobacteriaceae bacterium]MDB4203411.1 hypothetical protein [Flavobacteriaceae bacterium]MDC1199105.1 hypothetical protein [Flavobacteriaceae bacterium]MDC1373459.1 hypothetical protein [Flavobacteriaceae bacterium]